MVQYKTPKEVFALHISLDLDMHDENKIKTRMSIHVHELQKRCMMLIESNQTFLIAFMSHCAKSHWHTFKHSSSQFHIDSGLFPGICRLCHLFEGLYYFLWDQQHETDAHRHELCKINNTWNCPRICANTEICPVHKRRIHLFFLHPISSSESNSNYNIIRFYTQILHWIMATE